MVYFGKDETYNDILHKLSARLGESKDQDLSALLASMIELLEYLDKKEEEKTMPTMD